MGTWWPGVVNRWFQIGPTTWDYLQYYDLTEYIRPATSWEYHSCTRRLVSDYTLIELYEKLEHLCIVYFYGRIPIYRETWLTGRRLVVAPEPILQWFRDLIEHINDQSRLAEDDLFLAYYDSEADVFYGMTTEEFLLAATGKEEWVIEGGIIDAEPIIQIYQAINYLANNLWQRKATPSIGLQLTAHDIDAWGEASWSAYRSGAVASLKSEWMVGDGAIMDSPNAVTAVYPASYHPPSGEYRYNPYGGHGAFNVRHSGGADYETADDGVPWAEEISPGIDMRWVFEGVVPRTYFDPEPTVHCVHITCEVEVDDVNIGSTPTLETGETETIQVDPDVLSYTGDRTVTVEYEPTTTYPSLPTPTDVQWPAPTFGNDTWAGWRSSALSKLWVLPDFPWS